MNLFDDFGGYNYLSFKGPKGIWTIIGTSSQVNHKNPMLCIDSFKSDKGEYLDLKREEVKDWADQGKIIPIESSKIKPKSYDRKRKVRAV